MVDREVRKPAGGRPREHLAQHAQRASAGPSEHQLPGTNKGEGCRMRYAGSRLRRVGSIPERAQQAAAGNNAYQCTQKHRQVEHGGSSTTALPQEAGLACHSSAGGEQQQRTTSAPLSTLQSSPISHSPPSGHSGGTLSFGNRLANQHACQSLILQASVNSL